MDKKISALGSVTPSGADIIPVVQGGVTSKATLDSLPTTSTVTSALATKALDSAVVHNTGNENVAGIKTFASSPIVPTPTTDMQAATKKYVDDNAGGGSQTLINSSDATSHTVTLSDSGGSVKLVEGANITITTTGTAGDGIVTIAASASGTGEVTGPATNTADYIPQWNGTDSKALKNGIDPATLLTTSTGLKLDQSTPQTVQGRPVFDDGLQFGLTPTVGAFSEGKLYFDEQWRTLSFNLDSNVNMQIGQEDYRYLYNNTGAPIPNGSAVYTTGVYTGGTNNVTTIALAKADDPATSQVIGITTQEIANNSYGFVTVRGHINDLNTNAWSNGDILWLSDSTAGELTNVAPSSPSLKIRVGRSITKSATVGRINVRIIPLSRVEDLSDVVITTPLVDEVLTYNGLSWINKVGGAVSAGAGVSYFPDDTEITGTGANNIYPIKTLSPTPVVTAEEVDSISITSATSPVLYGSYLYNTALGRTLLDAGIWNFEIYAGVSSSTNTTSLTQNINRVRPGTGTITTTDLTATSKTATASTGTPFLSANVDVSGTIDTDSFLQTPQGYYRILTRVDNVTVTISVPSTYTNEVGVAYSTHKKLFGITTGEINTVVGASPYILSLFSISSVQPSFIVEATDKLATTFFGVSNGTRVVYFSHNGTARYSHLDTPFSTKHNDLSGLQGGAASEYYHLTSAEYTGTGTGVFVRTTAPQISTIELGHASDTTLSRVSAGKTAVEGVNQGTEGILQNSQSAAYTTVLTDAGKHIYHPSADTTARTWTIDSNTNVAYPIGTAITFVNDTSAGTLTIAITSDTLVLAGAGTTGSRTLTANGVATAIKVTSTRWVINGTNLT